MDPTAQTTPPQQSTTATPPQPSQTNPNLDAIIQQSQPPPKKKIPFIKILIALFALAVVGFGIFYIGVYSRLNAQLDQLGNRRNTTPTNAVPTQSQQEEIPYVSQRECESRTGKSCVDSSCDFIPKGKKPEEVCGTRIKKGWYPIQAITPAQKQAVCTQEAKQCPDGSYVSRTGQNCEFAPCTTTKQ